MSRALLAARVPVAGLGLNPHLPFPLHLPPQLAGAPELTWNSADALRQALDAGPTLYHLMA
ncbi:MAG: hypothetical protein H0V95_06450, partial [Actinobacteria bacterium]|nr:hypothetical protein [Actinomycetota bacterium]